MTHTVDFNDYTIIKDIIYQALMELQDLNGYIVEDIDALIFAERTADEITDYLNNFIGGNLTLCVG